MTRLVGLSALLLIACGGGGGGDAGADGAVALTCASYCNTISANCTETHTQYVNAQACMASCAAFPPGTAADTSGNTLGCRIYHAGAARSIGPEHCTHAGPGGDAFCGMNCEGFCTIALRACTGANQQYGDMTTCMNECAMFPTGESYDISDTDGDTFACRLYHLTVASTDTDSAMTHCPHIRMNSPVCL